MKCKLCGNPIDEKIKPKPYYIQEGYCSEKCYNEDLKIKANKEKENRLKDINENLENYMNYVGIRPGLTRIMLKCKLSKAKQKILNDFITLDNNIYIFGKPNVGKTIFCAFAIRKLIEINKECYFISFPDIFLNVMDIMSKRGSVSSYIKRLSNIKILLLDDLAAGNLTPFNNFLTYELINSRIEMGLKTLITSNLSIDGINDIIGSRIASRLLREYKIKNFIKKMPLSP